MTVTAVAASDLKWDQQQQNLKHKDKRTLKPT